MIFTLLSGTAALELPLGLFGHHISRDDRLSVPESNPFFVFWT